MWEVVLINTTYLWFYQTYLIFFGSGVTYPGIKIRPCKNPSWACWIIQGNPWPRGVIKVDANVGSWQFSGISTEECIVFLGWCHIYI